MGLTIDQVLLMLAASAIVTPVFVLLIPHARQSPTFDRLLVAATFAISFLGAWAAQTSSAAGLSDWRIADVPVVPIALGALGGALALNLVLWLLDKLEHPDQDSDNIPDENGDNTRGD